MLAVTSPHGPVWGEERISGVLALGERCRERERALRSAAGASAPAKRQTWRGSEGGTVQLWCGTSLERLEIDRVKGPKLLLPSGGVGYMGEAAQWQSLDSADQKLLAYRAAERNKRTAGLLVVMAAEAEELAWERAADESPEKRMHMRCEKERSKKPLQWFPIGLETVSEGHERIASGMIYGLPFPWSEETLVQFGPEWLTSAFHACESISKSNRVTRIIVDRTKITAGNNSGKFLFDVEYAKEDPSLHTKLFAKIPFAMTPATKSDRFSSSVYKQPMDFYEINTYRICETCFPFKTPRFYFGDISNETSNFILIAERIDFAELDGIGRRSLAPLEIEGPYDKCKDFQLQGRDKEYYMLLLAQCAKIAAFHKTGRFGSEEFLQASLSMARPGRPRHEYGCNPSAASGLPPSDFSRKLDAGYEFISNTARVIYPSYVTEESFREKFLTTMMTRAAYHAEIDCWKHSDPSYVALGHQNLNIDNAFFWREADGRLDCGIFDWGGFGSNCLGHKMYWIFNCSDFEQFRDNLDEYLEHFIHSYRIHGGPQLDQGTLRKQVLLTALENMQMMMLAVPNCFKMCPSKEWATIKDRHDPRISGNIDGKTTLRTSLHCLGNGIRILQELKADELLDSWIQDTYVAHWGLEAKTDDMIHGRPA